MSVCDTQHYNVAQMGQFNVYFVYIIPLKVQKLQVVAYKCVSYCNTSFDMAVNTLRYRTTASWIYCCSNPNKDSAFNPRSPADEQQLVHSSRGGDATDGRTPSQLTLDKRKINKQIPMF